MWIIAHDGFVSLVQHRTDPTLIRARARRREHLADTFDVVDPADIIDLGVNAPDYRWAVNLPRATVAQVIHDAVMDIDYVSHVKEEVAGKDDLMYSAMLRCWSALMTLQRPEPLPRADWWTPPIPDTYAPGFDEDFDNDDAVAMGPDADMTVDQALDVATEWSDPEPEDWDEVVVALQVLAAAVRERQPERTG